MTKSQRLLAVAVMLISCGSLAASAFAQNKEADDQKSDPSKTKTSHSTEGDNQIDEAKFFNKNGLPVKTDKTTVTREGKTTDSETYKNGKLSTKTTTKTDNFGKTTETRTETYNEKGVLISGTITGPKVWKVFNRETGKYEDSKPVKPFSYVPNVGEKPVPKANPSPEPVQRSPEPSP